MRVSDLFGYLLRSGKFCLEGTGLGLLLAVFFIRRHELTRSFVETSLARFPFLVSALSFLTVECAELTAFRSVLDDLVRDPAPEPRQIVLTLWHFCPLCLR